jgi:hypothetical protein
MRYRNESYYDMSHGMMDCEERGVLTHGMSLKSSFRTRALSCVLS